jgi:hypothetical protein
VANKEHEELIAALQEVTDASNRTNHAVRAIVLPLTILLVSQIVALPLLFLSFFGGVGGALILVVAALALLGGAILAIIAQLKETKASEIPVPSVTSPVQGSSDATAKTALEAERVLQAPAESSSDKCRFCGKPFAPGVYDRCEDCGKN